MSDGILKMIDLISIIGELMLNGYSDAVDLKIGTKYTRIPDHFSAKSFKNDGEWRIIVNRKLMNSNLKVVSGMMAHELSHIIRMSKLSFYNQRKDLDLYRTSLYKDLDERNTDLDVILRGYGGELLSYKMFLLSTGVYIDEGLTINEAKKLIRQKG